MTEMTEHMLDVAATATAKGRSELPYAPPLTQNLEPWEMCVG